jgi:hypothetical protein
MAAPWQHQLVAAQIDLSPTSVEAREALTDVLKRLGAPALADKIVRNCLRKSEMDEELSYPERILKTVESLSKRSGSEVLQVRNRREEWHEPAGGNAAVFPSGALMGEETAAERNVASLTIVPGMSSLAMYGAEVADRHQL